MRLPDEDEVKPIIRQRLKPELDLASDILDLGTGIFDRPGTIETVPGLDELVVVIALGLVAKACKQYRAIGELVELGLGEVVGNNLHILLETMLAVEFILRRKVLLKQNGKLLPPIKGKALTTRFRAALYMANDAFNARKFVLGLMATPGLKRQLSVETRNQAVSNAMTWEAEIGTDWAKRVKRYGYAGVSVSDLADSLGHTRLYAAIYRLNSAGVHSSDAMSYVRDGDHDEWHFLASADPPGIANPLCLASQLVLKIILTIDKRLRLGLRHRLKNCSRGQHV